MAEPDADSGVKGGNTTPQGIMAARQSFTQNPESRNVEQPVHPLGMRVSSNPPTTAMQPVSENNAASRSAAPDEKPHTHSVPSGSSSGERAIVPPIVIAPPVLVISTGLAASQRLVSLNSASANLEIPAHSLGIRVPTNPPSTAMQLAIENNAASRGGATDESSRTHFSPAESSTGEPARIPQALTDSQVHAESADIGQQASGKLPMPSAASIPAASDAQGKDMSVHSGGTTAVQRDGSERNDTVTVAPDEDGTAMRSAAAQPVVGDAFAPGAIAEDSPACGASDAAANMFALSVASAKGMAERIGVARAVPQTSDSGVKDLSKPASSGNGTVVEKVKTSEAVAGTSAALGANGFVVHSTAQRPDANPSTVSPDPSGATSPASAASIHASAVVASGAAPTADAEKSVPATSHSDPGAIPFSGPETPATSSVSAASLTRTMSETEMRVAVHSIEFGAVSIRTSLSQQQMTTQITVEHDDLSKALSSHIPAMEERLGSDLGVRTVVQVNQAATASSGEGGGSSHDGRESTRAAPTLSGIAPGSRESEDAGRHFAVGPAQDARLDIRA